ncbi:unnamed protein product [Pleuronectes platessa]|uniref:Uncharacterized protein n=1 Tax=Pleuronectes platessa TaxID=8262 RepID=A0A9N7YV55_PLEPL|nr:unnamed protein product [Pleuronectes platessa]
MRRGQEGQNTRVHRHSSTSPKIKESGVGERRKTAGEDGVTVHGGKGPVILLSLPNGELTSPSRFPPIADPRHPMTKNSKHSGSNIRESYVIA